MKACRPFVAALFRGVTWCRNVTLFRNVSLVRNVTPFCAAALVSAAALLPVAVCADDYPSRAVRIIVPFAPGGVTDTSARAITDRLAARLGQQVIVENRPGASGNIGTAAVAHAPADGYTLLLAFDGTMVINPHLYPGIPFDTLRDFAYVSKMGDAAIILCANPGVPAKNFAELLALSKAKPGTLSYGTSGTGSTPHVAGELLKQRTGLDMVHVPYKGGGPAVADVVGGQLPLVFTAIASSQQYIKSGRLRGIATAGGHRTAALPDVPTFIESGVEGFETDSWVGIAVPARTPSTIIERLHRDIAAVMRESEVRERYAVLGIEPVGNRPEEFTEQIRTDLSRWGEVVRKAGIRIAD